MSSRLKSTASASTAAAPPSALLACRDDPVDPSAIGGCLFLFGRNEHGELHRGHKQNLIRPVAVAPPSTLAAMAFGHEHAVALTIQHEIFSAGSWVAGKQCDPEVTSHVTRLRKIKAAELQGKHFIKVACGESHSVALTSEGELYSWGGTRHGKLGRAVPHAAAAPSTTSSTSGFGSSAASKAAQQALKAAAEAAAAEADKPMSFKVPGALALKRVVQISCGRLHTVVSTSEGQVFSFGGNEQGQLGLPGCKESDTPKLVAGKLSNVSVRSVVCGAFFTFALSETREVYAWGDGSFGQLGRGDSCATHREPACIEQVNKFGPVRSIACGENFTVVALESGRLLSFGYGQQGQLGHGGSNNNVENPRVVAALKDVHIVQIAAGSQHVLALSADHQVYSWGYNQYGQLGHGHTKTVSTPTLIEHLRDIGILTIAAGGAHSLCSTSAFLDATDMVTILARAEDYHEVVQAAARRSVARRSDGGQLLATFLPMLGVPEDSESADFAPTPKPGALNTVDLFSGTENDLISPASGLQPPDEAWLGSPIQGEVRNSHTLLPVPPTPFSPIASNDQSMSVAETPLRTVPFDTCPLVEPFYSKLVTMVHRYIVFEMLATSPWTEQMIQDHIDSYVAAISVDDDAMLFHNFVSSPVVVEAATFSAPRTRHTLLMVTRVLEPHSPNPFWAVQFFDMFGGQCGALSMREVLPESLQPDSMPKKHLFSPISGGPTQSQSHDMNDFDDLGHDGPLFPISELASVNGTMDLTVEQEEY